MSARSLFTAAVAAAWMTLNIAGSPLHARDRIDANPSRRYLLTKEHGPWMIMVATFHTTGADGQTDEGKSPEQAADELVLELRRRQMPAYVFVMEGSAEPFVTYDQAGREVRRKNLRRVKSIGVLAGNYGAIDDSDAQQSLAWIKKLEPDCLKEGVTFHRTEQRPTPLSAAFLTVNPMMSADDLAAYRGIDDFVLRLNHGERNSLLSCNGKHTLVVGTFAGKTAVETYSPFGNKSIETDDDLDIAAKEASDLAAALREIEKVEAFVWHTRYQSLVTVGSFDSPNDPAIARYRQRFAADERVNVLVPKFVNGVKMLAIDGSGNKIPDISNIGQTTLPEGFRIWAFDPNPRLMAVPKRQGRRG